MVNTYGEHHRSSVVSINKIAIKVRLIIDHYSIGLLPGVFREALLASGEVVEDIITVDELMQAQKVSSHCMLHDKDYS